MKRVQAALVITVAIGIVGPTRAQEADDVVRLVRLSTIADEIGSWRDAEVTAWGRDAGAPFLTVTNLAFRSFSYRVYGASCQPAASPQDQECAGLILRKKMRHDGAPAGRLFAHEWDRAHAFAGAWVSDVDGGLMMRQAIVLDEGVTWGSVTTEARRFHTETMPDFCQAVIDRFRS